MATHLPTAAAVALALVLACTRAEPAAAPRAPTVTGPLCSMLPTGAEPGSPALLRDQTPDIALQWIPVATTVEAAVRATGMSAQLRRNPAVTILAPTDDAFDRAMDDDTRDQLLLFRHNDLRRLLRAHIVRGTYSLSELVEAGTVQTLAGGTLNVARTGGMVRFADRADSVCGGYVAGNARIHVIDGLVVDPPQGPTGEHKS